MTKHIAIFTKEEIEQIFSGEKRVDVRVSQKKTPPYLEISVGDLVFFKSPKNDIVGQFKLKKAFFLEGIEEMDLDFLEKKYEVSIPKKEIAKYLTIIFLDEVEKFITSPIKIDKKSSKSWVVLE